MACKVLGIIPDTEQGDRVDNLSQLVNILAAKPEGFGLIPGSHMVEQENQLVLIILVVKLIPWHVYTHINKIKINVIFLREGWDGKMVQWLIALSVPPEDQVSSLAPTRWLPITWNYSTRGSYTILFSVGTKDAYSAQKYMGLFVCLFACLKALTARAQAPVSVLSTRIK